MIRVLDALSPADALNDKVTIFEPRNTQFNHPNSFCFLFFNSMMLYLLEKGKVN